MMHALISTLVLALSTSALNPIAVRNNVFYDTATNQRFFMVGVDYQPGGASAFALGSDPLSNIDVCRRDVYLFQQLKINTLRVYNVDNALNHDACMSLYDTAGIYIILDVNTPLENQHLNRDKPYEQYNRFYADHVFRTIEAFGGYRNTLGFFSGNELINSDLSAFQSAPYIKAITRDMKSYIRKHLNRPIPVGYSAADDTKYRIETATYMACGSDSEGVNDFYSINSYQWCGTQTIQSSGYDVLISQFSNFTLPLFFSEYGCNEVRPRSFGEVAAVYGSQMTGKFSGGLIYEYTQETNNYGLVQLNDTTARILPDYVALQSQFARISGLPTSIAASQAALQTCPPASSYRYLNGSLSIPSLPEIEAIIAAGVSKSGGTITSAALTTPTYVINDVSGRAIAQKVITQASSSGTAGDLKSLFPTNTGTARVAAATGAVSGTGGSLSQQTSAGSSSGSRSTGTTFEISLAGLGLSMCAVLIGMIV